MNIPFITDIMNDREKKNIFFIYITAAVFVAYLLLIAFPQARGVLKMAKASVTLKDDLKTAGIEIEKTPSYVKTLEEQKTKIVAGQMGRLMQEGEMPNLLESLSAMANSSGVKIVGITPAAMAESASSATEGVFKEAQIAIVAKSGYHELGVFVNKIENADRFMRISDIGIISNKASPKKHDVKLLISAYILKPEKGV